MPLWKCKMGPRCSPWKDMYWRDRTCNTKGESLIFYIFKIILQKIYGDQTCTLGEIIELGLLPESFRSYRQSKLGVFDIETLQQPIETDECNSLVYEAVQFPVSIGFASNIQGFEQEFFIRSSSDPEDGYQMVKKFLNHLALVRTKFLETIPVEITDAIERLQIMSKQKFSKKKLKLVSHLNFLKRFTQEMVSVLIEIFYSIMR